MSEYQVYKFKTIDRPLTREERAEISSWSSRTTASSSGATFTYSYGDFPMSEKKVVRDYFDVFLYFSNWGTKRLMLKFPLSLIHYDAIAPYDISVDTYGSAGLELSRGSGYLIMDFELSDEEGDEWPEEDDYDLSDFVAIREAILNGDYSALYLFWLKMAEMHTEDQGYYDEDEDEDDYNDDDIDTLKTPPVPPQLKQISAPLQEFINFFNIDVDIVAAAQSISQQLSKTSPTPKDYKKLISHITDAEKNDYLLRLINGEPRLDLTLRKHLDGFSNTQNTTPKTVSLAEIKFKQKLEEEKRIAATKAEAERKHLAKMKDLENAEASHWEAVYFNLDRKTGKSYDLAVATLKDLKELAIHKNQLVTFNIKMSQIKTDYKRSTSLKRRFDNAKL